MLHYGGRFWYLRRRPKTKVAILFRAFRPKEKRQKRVYHGRRNGEREDPVFSLESDDWKERGNKECVPNINWEENVCEFSFSNEGSRRRRRDASLSLSFSLCVWTSNVQRRRVNCGFLIVICLILLFFFEDWKVVIFKVENTVVYTTVSVVR